MSRINVGIDRYSDNFDTTERPSFRSFNRSDKNTEINNIATQSLNGVMEITEALPQNSSLFGRGTIQTESSALNEEELVAKYQKNPKGWDPLAYALSCYDYDAVLALANHQANSYPRYSVYLSHMLATIEMDNEENKCPQLLSEKQESIARALFEKMISSNEVSPMRSAVSSISISGRQLMRFKMFDCLERLFKLGYDINQYNGALLKDATRNSDESAVSFLIKQGAKVENGFGHDYLRRSIENADSGLVRIFLENGADVHKKYEEYSLHYTLLDIAKQREAKPELIALLKQYGATSNELERAQKLLPRYEQRSKDLLSRPEFFYHISPNVSPIKLAVHEGNYRHASDLLCLIENDELALFEVIFFFCCYETGLNRLKKILMTNMHAKEEMLFLNNLVDKLILKHASRHVFIDVYIALYESGNPKALPLLKRLSDYGVADSLGVRCL